MKNIFLLLTIIGLCLPAHSGEKEASGGNQGSQKTGNPDHREIGLLLDRATRYYNDSRYGDAMRDLRAIIALDPNHYEAWHYLGGCNHHLEDYPGAIRAYTRALEINPRSEYSYLNRGMARHRHGAMPEAISDYSRSLEIRREFFKSLYFRGLAYIETGNYDSAIGDLDMALKLDPGHYASWYLKGLARYKKGDREGWQADYSQAVKLSLDRVLPEYRAGGNPFRLRRDDPAGKGVTGKEKTNTPSGRDKEI